MANEDDLISRKKLVETIEAAKHKAFENRHKRGEIYRNATWEEVIVLAKEIPGLAALDDKGEMNND